MGGFARFAEIAMSIGGDSDGGTLPTLWQLLALVLAAMLVVAALTTVPPPRPPSRARDRSSRTHLTQRQQPYDDRRIRTAIVVALSGYRCAPNDARAHTTKAAVSPNVHA